MQIAQTKPAGKPGQFCLKPVPLLTQPTNYTGPRLTQAPCLFFDRLEDVTYIGKNIVELPLHQFGYVTNPPTNPPW
ncbi:MAG: hypothetical protein KA314_04440, partial [Chloroflexi bacterium]|nr:hypothetical protein [Chloroflexota bacterium]